MVATPWDANMDAEQKLKGRFGVDDWVMPTTAHCQQQTGDGLTISLPVHFQHDKAGIKGKRESTSATALLPYNTATRLQTASRKETQHQQHLKPTFPVSGLFKMLAITVSVWFPR